MEFTKESLSVDKVRMSLLEPEFLEKVAAVLTDGAKKYSTDNWKKCPDKSLYVDALLRHINAWQQGESVDKDTGISHLAHAACNLMFLDWMENNEPKQ